MDNQNSLPSANISPSTEPAAQRTQPQMPTTTARPSEAQIFIHPEHDAGTLAIAQSASRAPTRKRADKMLVFLSIMIAILIISGSAFVFILIPRSQNVSFANSVKDTVSTGSEKAEKVKASLEVLYKARTGEQDDVTLSDSRQGNATLIATGQEQGLGFFNAAANLTKQTRDNLDQKEDVKGFAVPAYDPNQESRKHRELADDISKKATDALELNNKLVDLAEISVPSGAKELKEQASKLEKSTAGYIDQALDTSKYYVDLSEAAIELVRLASSIYSAKDIDNAISTLSGLKTKFAEYEKTKLPEGMENYNKDIVETFDLLLIFYQDVQGGKLNTEQKILNAYESFVANLQSISVRAVSDEISFWQNNQALNSYDELADQQTNVLKTAEQVKDQNNFFLLEWTGTT